MSRQLFIQNIKTQLKTDPLRFYVYAYLRSKDSITGKKWSVYYIGKGQCERAWKPHRTKTGGTHTPNDDYIIIMESHLTEVGAFALERRYIEWYGRKDNNTGILMNQTNGGDGATGHNRPHTLETKKKLSLMRIGENNPMYGLSGEKSPSYGTKRSEETKQKLSALKQGEKNNRFGTKHSPETIEKMKLPRNWTYLKCPHCNKTGLTQVMNRKHFNNCKYKNTETLPF